MTREEQIVNAAKDSEKQIGLSGGVSSYGIGFLEGATWADEHSKEGLWDKDKVCRWIREHLTFNDDKWYTENDYVKGIMDEVIEDLTKAMEEQE